MELYRNKYLVKSTRLHEWDYSSSGCYFVTICTRNRVCVLGEINGGRDVACNVSTVKLSGIGKIVQQNWLEIPQHFKFIKLDEFIIMPNHVHGIVIITDNKDNFRRDVACNVSTSGITMAPIFPKRGSLSTVIRSYKASVTKWCNENNIANFAWQDRYYEHIIRNEQSLAGIRKYIVYNPLKWESDEENPENS